MALWLALVLSAVGTEPADGGVTQAPLSAEQKETMAACLKQCTRAIVVQSAPEGAELLKCLKRCETATVPQKSTVDATR